MVEKQAEFEDLRKGAAARGGRRNYSFVAWKQYYMLQYDEEGEDEWGQDIADDNRSMMSAETEAQGGEPEFQLGENTELEFGNNLRSPMEDIETESMTSKRIKGSLLGSRIGGR